MSDFFLHKNDEGDITNLQVLADNLKELEAGRYLVRIEKANKRSHNQNAYYWGVVCQLVYEGLKDLGFDNIRNKDDAHEVMKNLFLKTKEQIGEVTIETVRSTKDLTRTEFMDYLQHIEMWASDYLSISIPPPSTQLTVC